MKNPIVTIEMENGNKMKVELYPDIAPNTVKNFVSLVKKGFYDGVIFHRVIPGFMIQGGVPRALAPADRVTASKASLPPMGLTIRSNIRRVSFPWPVLPGRTVREANSLLWWTTLLIWTAAMRRSAR